MHCSSSLQSPAHQFGTLSTFEFVPSSSTSQASHGSCLPCPSPNLFATRLQVVRGRTSPPPNSICLSPAPTRTWKHQTCLYHTTRRHPPLHRPSEQRSRQLRAPCILRYLPQISLVATRSPDHRIIRRPFLVARPVPDLRAFAVHIFQLALPASLAACTVNWPSASHFPLPPFNLDLLSATHIATGASPSFLDYIISTSPETSNIRTSRLFLLYIPAVVTISLGDTLTCCPSAIHSRGSALRRTKANGNGLPRDLPRLRKTSASNISTTG